MAKVPHTPDCACKKRVADGNTLSCDCELGEDRRIKKHAINSWKRREKCTKESWFVAQYFNPDSAQYFLDKS